MSYSMSLKLLSIVIPARDEEGCVASTIEHLQLELELRGVPHEIIVVDEGSTDRTWQILQAEAARLNAPPRVCSRHSFHCSQAPRGARFP
jgi:dolichol-phosphate mannosyltransferase